jgi:hypothetical protein
MIGGMKLVPSEDQHVLEMKAGGHRAFEWSYMKTWHRVWHHPLASLFWMR